MDRIHPIAGTALQQASCSGEPDVSPVLRRTPPARLDPGDPRADRPAGQGADNLHALPHGSRRDGAPLCADGRFADHRFTPSIADHLAFQQALECLPAAFLLLDSTGLVVFANREALALLRSSAALRLDATGVLHCADRDAEKLLRSIVGSAVGACSAAWGPGDRVQNTAFAIAREGTLPLIVFASYGPPSHSGSKEETRIIVLIRDPLKDPNVRREALRAVFGLSVAEADVVSKLVAGAELRQIAADRRVQLVTVRNQLKAALAKLGVARQSELVSVVLRASYI